MHPRSLRSDLSPRGSDLALATAWRSRALGEARVGETFARLADALLPGEVHAFVRDGLRAASLEELGHAEVCLGMVARYGGVQAIAHETARDPLPLATPLERALLLVTLCCISETIATAYFEHCLRVATDEPARIALKSLLRDEVGHAQLGWGYLGSLPADAPMRQALEPSLAGLIKKTEATWQARIAELHAAPDAARGYPLQKDSAAIVSEAVTGLVTPGFAALGLRV